MRRRWRGHGAIVPSRSRAHRRLVHCLDGCARVRADPPGRPGLCLPRRGAFGSMAAGAVRAAFRCCGVRLASDGCPTVWIGRCAVSSAWRATGLRSSGLAAAGLDGAGARVPALLGTRAGSGEGGHVVAFVRGEDAAAELDAESDFDVLTLTRSLDLRELVEDELLLALPLVPRTSSVRTRRRPRPTHRSRCPLQILLRHWPI